MKMIQREERNEIHRAQLIRKLQLSRQGKYNEKVEIEQYLMFL
jgi:hypothetical protein